MTSVADSQIGQYLKELAARSSTPGGGAAAALTGSQAAALLCMVINFTLDNKRYASVQSSMQDHLAKAEQLQSSLLALADRDAEAFEGVSACYSMPKETDEEKAARTEALQAALKVAANVPFVTAEKCLDVLELAAPVGRDGNKNVVSDAATATFLAMAGLRSAVINVNINLKFINDDEFVAERSGRRDELLDKAQAAYVHAKEVCAQSLGIPL